MIGILLSFFLLHLLYYFRFFFCYAVLGLRKVYFFILLFFFIANMVFFYNKVKFGKGGKDLGTERREGEREVPGDGGCFGLR